MLSSMKLMPLEVRRTCAESSIRWSLGYPPGIGWIPQPVQLEQPPPPLHEKIVSASITISPAR